MGLYLTYSAISMGILLLLYHLFLEKEKMHRTNRAFLLFSLVFSLTIPLIPVGIGDQIPDLVRTVISAEQLTSGETTELSREFLLSDSYQVNPGFVPVQTNTGSSTQSWLIAALVLYALVCMILFVRLLRIIYMIQLKADRNPKRLLQGCELVLLNESIVPHTFMNTIFVNRYEYESGQIGRDILIHEQTHVRQKHSFDLLFVEMLKIIFWFNPLLYQYKKAILLNHEFLADQAVIQSGTEVKEYQALLLNTLLARPAHGLSHSFNFALTKKRLHMMTQPVSRLRSSLKLLSVIPVVLMLAFLFGCESTPADVGSSDKTVTIAFTDSESIILNGEEIDVSTLDDRLSKLSETYELHFIIEDHPEMLAGPVMEVTRLVQRYRSMDEGKAQDVIVIDINDRSEIVIDETVHTLDELRSTVSNHAERANLIISLRVQRGAEIDTILSVQSLFREVQVSRIHYSTIQQPAATDDSDTTLRQKLADLNTAARSYMELSPESHSYDELDRKYQDFLRKHDTFYEAQLRLYEDSLNTPPPPPIVPSPETRLNNRFEANDNRAPSSSEQKDTSAKEMKIFSILINAQGSLLINEQPGSPSDVKDAVKDFVAETKELPVMAVVAIRTDRRTPYDVYLEVIREASAAYNELRDRASYERFGVPFSALAPDSEQQTEIRDLYPKRISAAEPETRNNG